MVPKHLILGSLLASAILASPDIHAQQNLRLSSSEGAVSGLSAPLDIRKTRSWTQSGGKVDWNVLLQPTGVIANRGDTTVTMIVYATAVDTTPTQFMELRTEKGRHQVGFSPARSTRGNARYCKAKDCWMPVGTSDTPVLMEVKLRPGQKINVETQRLRNQPAIGRMMAAGPVYLGMLAVADKAADGTVSAAEVEYALFDMPMRLKAFPGETFFPGDSFFPGEAFFPGDSFAPLRLSDKLSDPLPKRTR